ncbi:MAG: metallophosphoesterase [Clostridia bacterium]|nr:metallophosphoesterase [Clostridia bacterium]
MNRRPNKSRTGYDSFAARHTSRFQASTPDTHFFDIRKKRPAGLYVFFALLALVCVLLVVNLASNLFVHVARVSVPVRALSSDLDGYTLLHISDLKGASFGQNQRRLRLALSSSEYDAVVFTGDMISERGNAQPFYELIDLLKSLSPDVPIYFIPGDSDPTPASMAYTSGGSPFAPWVLGANQRGAQLLSSPQAISRKNGTFWLCTPAQLNLDIDTMQGQFEQQYLRARRSGDENEIELATYNLQWLEQTRKAREAMQESEGYVALSHAPPSREELSAAPDSPLSRVSVVLCGHYLGGLMRLPLLGPVFVPSQNLPRYGLLPGDSACSGLHREDRTWIYINPGLGASSAEYPSFFFRLFNPPTISLVTLTPSTM